jgi:hypothetical protein
VLEALVQPLKDVEDEDPVFNGCAEVNQTIGHGLELAAVLIDREVTLNKSVRINCIGLVGLHHQFYKGAAGPLRLQGCATPGAASPVCRLPSSRHP